MTENPQPHTGRWPVPEPVDLDAIEQADQGELYVQRAAERALHEMVLGSIRHHLDQQPSTSAIRAAATRWKTEITNLADELINTRRTER